MAKRAEPKQKRGGARAPRRPSTSPAMDALDNSFSPHGLAPLGAGKWSPICKLTSLSLQGGFAKKPVVVESIDVGSETFLKLEKSSEWLLKMSGGPKMQRGGLARSRVVEKLRAACGMDSQRQEVNKDTNVDTDDPMQAVDACAYDGALSEQKRRKTYNHPKRAIEQVVSLEMPMRAVGRRHCVVACLLGRPSSSPLLITRVGFRARSRFVFFLCFPF